MARKFVQLINTQYLFERSLVDANVDPLLLNNNIIAAQEIHIQTVLGNSLYTKIMADAFDDVIAGKYLEILQDWIQPALSYMAVYMALPYLNYKLTNKSVAELGSTDSVATELGTIKYLRDDMKNRGEFFLQRIREFIINNQSSFPEYFTTTGIDQIHPKRDNYFSGIYTGNGGHCIGPNDENATIRIR